MALFSPKRVKAPPDEIASVFLTEFVANEDLTPTIEITMLEDQRPQCESRCKLYRLALVLMTLLNEEKTDPKVLHVRECIERRAFGLPDDQSRVLLKQVQNAMSDLQALLTPSGNSRELYWARSWFQQINIDAINPVDLTLFASSWMDQYVAATKSLRDFKITA